MRCIKRVIINRVTACFFFCLIVFFNSCSKVYNDELLAIVNVNIIPMDSERILELMVDATMNPLFTEEEFQKELVSGEK